MSTPNSFVSVSQTPPTASHNWVNRIQQPSKSSLNVHWDSSPHSEVTDAVSIKHPQCHYLYRQTVSSVTNSAHIPPHTPPPQLNPSPSLSLSNINAMRWPNNLAQTAVTHTIHSTQQSHKYEHTKSLQKQWQRQKKKKGEKKQKQWQRQNRRKEGKKTLFKWRKTRSPQSVKGFECGLLKELAYFMQPIHSSFSSAEEADMRYTLCLPERQRKSNTVSLIKPGLYYRCNDNTVWFLLQVWQDNKARSLLQV